MKSLKRPGLSLWLIASAGHAGELEEQISNLRAQYDSLEGYWAQYEAQTETGKQATFE